MIHIKMSTKQIQVNPLVSHTNYLPSYPLLHKTSINLKIYFKRKPGVFRLVMNAVVLKLLMSNTKNQYYFPSLR